LSGAEDLVHGDEVAAGLPSAAERQAAGRAGRGPLQRAGFLTGSVTIADMIRAEALKLGFSVARFAELPEVWAASERLEVLVEAGFHGDMAWMEETLERRKHPRRMWREAKGALVLGYNYGPGRDPLERLGEPQTANISVYARGDDYHELIKGKLKQLAGWMVAKTGGDVKVFV